MTIRHHHSPFEFDHAVDDLSQQFVVATDTYDIMAVMCNRLCDSALL